MISKTEAFSFLEAHQPMPDDNEVRKEELEQYEEVRQFFLTYKDEACIPLFLNSFGGKAGFGVYKMVEEVIMMYDKECVLPYMMDAFANPSASVRYWCIRIAARFPDDCLFDPLTRLLESEDEDIRAAAVTALSKLAVHKIRTGMVINVLRDAMTAMTDQELKEFAAGTLRDIQNGSHSA